MRLRNWRIDGFGVFLDAALPEPGLGDGFNLIVGPNEAGKSTLLDYLRYTLFGYPGGHSRLPRRIPLRGGNHSGMLVYEVDGLLYSLYRDANNKKAFQLRQNGDQLTKADLAAVTTGFNLIIVLALVGPVALFVLAGVEFNNVCVLGLDVLLALFRRAMP